MPAARTFLLAYGGQLRDTRPAMVRYAILEDEDAPERFAVVHAWASPEELARFNADAEAAIGARLGQHGGARVRFDGVVRLEVDWLG